MGAVTLLVIAPAVLSIIVIAAITAITIAHVFAPLLPAYWLMHWTASWRGLYQLIRAPFRREKTPHTAALAA